MACGFLRELAVVSGKAGGAPNLRRHGGVAAEKGREVALIFEADLGADFHNRQVFLR